MNSAGPLNKEEQQQGEDGNRTSSQTAALLVLVLANQDTAGTSSGPMADYDDDYDSKPGSGLSMPGVPKQQGGGLSSLFGGPPAAVGGGGGDMRYTVPSCCWHCSLPPL